MVIPRGQCYGLYQVVLQKCPEFVDEDLERTLNHEQYIGNI